jgi:flagellar hook-associated protein 1 FlgK
MVARGSYAADYTDMPVVGSDTYNIDLDKYNQSVGASIVMQIQTQLDTMVHSIVTSINDVLSPLKEITIVNDEGETETIRVLDTDKALIGDDDNETVAAELFSRRSVSRFTETTVTLEDGSSQTVMRYNEEDESDPYSLYTISQLTVNPEIVKDPSKIPTKNNADSGKYGGFAYEEWADMADSVHASVGVLDPNSTTTYNVFEYYSAMVTELASTGSVWSGIVDNQEITVNTTYNERQNVMGVSTDEELSNLIIYQQSYNASSRYITTVAEMLEYLIETLGG